MCLLLTSWNNSTLIFYCLVAKFIWRAVHITFNIDIPISVMHLFNDWANGMGPHMGKGLLIGAAALCWTMWTSRNDIVFNSQSKNRYVDTFLRDGLATVLGTVAKA
jgi:hypothetical protein